MKKIGSLAQKSLAQEHKTQIQIQGGYMRKIKKEEPKKARKKEIEHHVRLIHAQIDVFIRDTATMLLLFWLNLPQLSP